MADRINTDAAARPPKPARADVIAEGRWNDEGGAQVIGPATSSDVTTHHVTETLAPETATPVLDALQDEVMTVTSADGRPPTRRVRLAEWRWLGAGAVILIAGIAVWIALGGMQATTAIAVLGFTVILLVSATPVIAAALMRGREERTAREIAKAVRPDAVGH